MRELRSSNLQGSYCRGTRRASHDGMGQGRRGGPPGMNDLTRILSAIEQGDPQAAAQLLPLAYDELRKLAARKLAQEQPGQPLPATAPLHHPFLLLLATAHPPCTHPPPSSA